MDFEPVGAVRDAETIAAGRAIRELSTVRRAEVHWYEAHGIGRREMKIKFPLLD